MKRCPDCAEEVQDEARVCRYCGYSFDGLQRADDRDRITASARTHRIERRLLLLIGLLCAVGMLVGSFGPWVKVSAAFFSVSVSGTDRSNDGWLVVAAALVGALVFYAALLSSTKTTRIFTGLLATGAGVLGSAVCIYDRNQLSDALSKAPPEVRQSALLAIGWGLNLALVASVVFTATALVVTFTSNRSGTA